MEKKHAPRFKDLKTSGNSTQNALLVIIALFSSNLEIRTPPYNLLINGRDKDPDEIAQLLYDWSFEDCLPLNQEPLPSPPYENDTIEARLVMAGVAMINHQDALRVKGVPVDFTKFDRPEILALLQELVTDLALESLYHAGPKPPAPTLTLDTPKNQP